ncbi:glycosyltransferase family 2 protein, partial [Clostridium perfringens]
MKVSIIMPVYNMENTIGKSIESILRQTYKNIELIIVDDGSKDDSYSICQNFSKKDSRIKVFRTENRGSGPARNYGIEQASGEFVYFPDADDYIREDAISILVNSVKENRCDLVVFGYTVIDSNGKVISEISNDSKIIDGKDIRENYHKYCHMGKEYGIQGAPWNKFFSLNIIKENNIRYPNLRRHQDEGFIIRYVTYTQKVSFINAILYTYFKNSLKKEWEKYPIDYIINVKNLLKCKLDV